MGTRNTRREREHFELERSFARWMGYNIPESVTTIGELYRAIANEVSLELERAMLRLEGHNVPDNATWDDVTRFRLSEAWRRLDS